MVYKLKGFEYVIVFCLFLNDGVLCELLLFVLFDVCEYYDEVGDVVLYYGCDDEVVVYVVW